jgi:hypothetical protein
MNKHGEFLYIQGDLAGFPVGIKISVIKSSRLYRVVFAHSQNTDASLGPSLGSSRERFGQQLPALTAADQRYTSYTQRVSIESSTSKYVMPETRQKGTSPFSGINRWGKGK